MRLLLLQPPVADFYDTDIRLQPLGLGYLAAAVRSYAPDVEVVVRDYHHGWGRRTVALPAELADLRPYYFVADQSPFSAFGAYYHFGAPYEQIAEEVAAWAPDLVGISALFTPYYREALATARAIKARIDVPIVCGGGHVSAAPGSMLADDAVDFVIRGEGERPLVALLKELAGERGFERVPNLGFKHQGQPIYNQRADNYPLEALPPPDFGDLDAARYQLHGKPLAFVLTSRGCPHRCTFCSVHATFGHGYRRRSVDEIMAELTLRYRQGVRAFDFEDDNLTLFVPEMKELCRRIVAELPHDIELVAMNGLSYASLDSELLELMRAAGFSQLNLSLVSADAGVRRATKRPHTLEQYRAVVQQAHALGFGIVSYQILGLPGETLDSMIETLVLQAGLPILLGASPFYLIPGSPLAKDFPPQSEADFVRARLTALAIETEHVTRDQLYTLFITTRVIDFLKGLSFEGEATTLTALLAATEACEGRERIGLELLATLRADGVLYAATKQGRVCREHFDASLFAEVFARLETIATTLGQHIVVAEASRTRAPS